MASARQSGVREEATSAVDLSPMAACASAFVGAAAGVFVPTWVRRLPEPELDEEEHKPAYSTLAAWRPLTGLAVGWCALTGAAVGLVMGFSAALPAYLYLCVAGAVLGYIDLRAHRLPNAVVLPSYAVVALALLAAAAVDTAWDRLLWAGIGLAGLWGFFFVLMLIYPKGMGFGDVKLAGLLGLGLGWLGPGQLVVGVFGAFVLGGAVGIGLLLLRRVSRHTAIAFGPFLLLAFVLTTVVGEPLIAWYLSPPY